MKELLLQLSRDSHHQPGDQTKGDKPPRGTAIIPLTIDQLLHPRQEGQYFLHSGRLRLSELLPDGREVTRAVLHAGTSFTALQAGFQEADPAQDLYRIDRMILMALDETEVWVLPGPTTTSGRRP